TPPDAHRDGAPHTLRTPHKGAVEAAILAHHFAQELARLGEDAMLAAIDLEIDRDRTDIGHRARSRASASASCASAATSSRRYSTGKSSASSIMTRAAIRAPQPASSGPPASLRVASSIRTGTGPM